MKKKYTGREWSDNRLTRFQVGIIIALLFVFYAFQYESDRPIYLSESEVFEQEPIEQLKTVVVNTRPIPKQIVKSSDLSSEIEEVALEIYKPEQISIDPTVKQSHLQNRCHY